MRTARAFARLERRLLSGRSCSRIDFKCATASSRSALGSEYVQSPLLAARIPKRWPNAPRGAFGHLFGLLAAISGDWTYSDPRADLDEAVAHLKSIREQLRPESSLRSNRAKALAVRIQATVPIVYAAPPFSAIARQWQTQLNENSKVLAFSSTFPEADHNELVGWVEDARARSHRSE